MIFRKYIIPSRILTDFAGYLDMVAIFRAQILLTSFRKFNFLTRWANKLRAGIVKSAIEYFRCIRSLYKVFDYSETTSASISRLSKPSGIWFATLRFRAASMRRVSQYKLQEREKRGEREGGGRARRSCKPALKPSDKNFRGRHGRGRISGSRPGRLRAEVAVEKNDNGIFEKR